MKKNTHVLVAWIQKKATFDLLRVGTLKHVKTPLGGRWNKQLLLRNVPSPEKEHLHHRNDVGWQVPV